QGIVPGISQMQKYTAYYQPTSSFNPGPYFPPVELMRFFTPFGVGKFNDRVRIDGLEWNDETFYKQEVTDLKPLLEGEVWIGCFIGNYDGGGHIVSLDIKSYPNDYEWTLESNNKHIVEPLVNTCNVLEMAGQNYGRIFGTDSLTVSFWVADSNQKTTLRYISTGHGGWGGGDEFNPKENEIFIDGQKRFSHTPWRCDCGRYREWNPVSGNFWNGLSSSDLSRSGWCPGTATQPVYFDLTGLKPGDHTLTIAIPQGKPMEGGFSHWNVSATLIIEN
ncbi:MAG: glpgli family protein, partial [Bacteroidales bacterium]|nr:glpgli family protein [Bacteroidales bacterium]